MATERKIRQLVVKRNGIGTSLANIHKFVNEFNPDTDYIGLQPRLDKLEELWMNFEDVQTQIEIADDNPASSSTYLADRGKFEDEFYFLKSFLASKIPSVPSNSSQHTFVAPSTALKLPRITLPEFDGNFNDWITFRDTYVALIHSCLQISNIQKFHYLRAALKGDALRIIESIALTGANYQIAWNLINNRYQNKTLLIKKHIKSLFELTTIKKDNFNSLNDAIDEFQKHVNILKNLGESVDTWDSILIHILSNQLDVESLREWEMEAPTDNMPTLESMLKFLQKRSRALESIATNQSSQSQGQDKAKHKPIANHAAFETGQKCVVCNNSHQIYQCESFLAMSPADRYNFVKNASLCTNCLRASHFASNCKSQHCRTCGRRHHTLLHNSQFFSSSSNQSTSSAPGPSTLTNSSSSSQQMTSSVPATSLAPSTSVVPATSSLSLEPSTSQSSLSSSLVGNITLPTVAGTEQASFPSRVPSSVVFLSTVLIKITDSSGQLHYARALLDNGSQSNFISEQMCQRLKLHRKKTFVPISGIGQSTTRVDYRTQTTIFSRINDFTLNVGFLILPKITHELPSQNINIEQWKLPADIQLADPSFNIASKIDLIIGAQFFYSLLRVGKIVLDKNLPELINSVFGWIVSGMSTECSEEPPSCCNVCLTDDLDNLLMRFWELEECTLNSNFSQEERQCEEHFTQNTRRDDSGRYIVKLPKKSERFAQIGNSKINALRRFEMLERRLARDPMLKQTYSEIIHEYLELNHMEPVSLEEEPPNVFYLPHHPVFKPDSSSTKVRVVFDASSKSSSGVSLNDLLLVGPVIQDDLFSIMLRFRIHQYVLTADVEKMYRQVLVDPSDRDCQRIFWRDEPNHPMQIYRLKTVTFGTASAPYLATRTLKQLTVDEQSNFPLAASKAQDFYVDDFISGTNDFGMAVQLRKQMEAMLEKGGFNLRKWASNHPELIADVPEEDKELKSTLNFDRLQSIKTLGLSWEPTPDQFIINIKVDFEGSQTITKRSVLSDIARVYDPLGIIGPIITKAKIFMQHIWSIKQEWDTILPEELRNVWTDFRQQLHDFKPIKIPRCVLPCSTPSLIQIHGFCDASESAYGAIIYIRCVDQNHQCSVTLLSSKSRVAPLKNLSIPRLELCAAFLLSHLLEKVTKSLKLDAATFLWSDSTIVLCWLSSPPSSWKTFVANRVSEIQGLTHNCDWRHVQSQDNSADLISRGVPPQQLEDQNLWWHGPKWLSLPEEAWPRTQHDLTIPEDVLEKRNTVIVLATSEEDWLFKRFSSYHRLIRAVAYCHRFCNNLRKPKSLRETGFLKINELDDSLISIIRFVQQPHFAEEFKQLGKDQLVLQKSCLKNLNAHLDKKLKIIRVGGRLNHSQAEFDQRNPIVLPHNHPLNQLIAENIHLDQLHCGPSMLLAVMRQNFWPLRGRTLVKRVVHQCVRCFRCKPTAQNQIMGSLPAPRVCPSRPFTHTGLDFCGPIYLARPTRKSAPVKAYVAIFVCFATKAVHIELVGDLSTKSFMGALLRFFSRRGVSSDIYSDNATNFVGTKNEMHDLYKLFQREDHQQTLDATITIKKVKWHFIPPGSPHFGGLWEAAVKSAKFHLKRIVGEVFLTSEEMLTVLARIEAVLNSRPLIPLSEDPSDLQVLTPGHFLIGGPMTTIHQPDVTEIISNRLDRWQRVQQLFQHFWKRWSVEYLSYLQQRGKWCHTKPNIKLNTMVLLKDDRLQPFLWSLGRVVEVHTGSDGKVRVVTVRTAQGTFKRAIVKICPLPFEDDPMLLPTIDDLLENSSND